MVTHMINTYANKLTLMQTFNSYRDLCNYLGEPIKGGNAKKSQLKEWECYFAYEKQGNKFIVTEIYDTPHKKDDKRGGNNNKNVKPFMDYLMSEFNTEYIDEYFTISNWSTIVLHLMNKEVCDKAYKDDKEVFQFCEENNILDPKLFREYVGAVKFVTKNLITTAFRGLQKRGLLEYQDGYKFYYEGAKYNRTVCVEGNLINDYIDEIEKEVCEIINNSCFADKNIKGRQLIYILRHSKNKELLQLYNDMRIDSVNKSNDICCLVNDAIMERDDATYDSGDFVDGEDDENGHRLLNYYRCYRITAFDDSLPKVDNKQEVIDIIQRLATKQITDIKYKRYGEEYYPYNNDESLDEIRKINNVLFKDVKKVSSIEEMIDEALEEMGKGLNDIFCMDLEYAS